MEYNKEKIEIITGKNAIRKCFDIFLGSVQDEREMWAVTLLEFYRSSLECWGKEFSIPEDFIDYESEIYRLSALKKKICPNHDYCTVQKNLELDYGPPWGYKDVEELSLSVKAFCYLVQYYLLCAMVFEKEGMFWDIDDFDMLEYMSQRSAKTAEECLDLAFFYSEYYGKYETELCEFAEWICDQAVYWFEEAADLGMPRANYELYNFITENNIEKKDINLLGLLRIAAQGGVTEAQEEIGSLFYFFNREWSGGPYIEAYIPEIETITLEEALGGLKKAEAKSFDAEYLIGSIYRYILKDYDKAVQYYESKLPKEFKKLNDDEQIWAQFLAEIYAEREDGKKDMEKSVRLHDMIEYSRKKKNDLR